MTRLMALFTVLVSVLMLGGIIGCDSNRLATQPDSAATTPPEGDQLLPLVNGQGPPLLEPPDSIKVRAEQILQERARGATPLQLIGCVPSGNIVCQANSWLGVRYVWGGNSRYGIDCSHLVYQVYRGAGVLAYPFMTTSQMRSSSWLAPVGWSGDREGDVVLFRYLGHTGIYIGSGWMIDANSYYGKVMYDYVWSSYWQSMGPYLVHYVGPCVF